MQSADDVNMMMVMMMMGVTLELMVSSDLNLSNKASSTEIISGGIQANTSHVGAFDTDNLQGVPKKWLKEKNRDPKLSTVWPNFTMNMTYFK